MTVNQFVKKLRRLHFENSFNPYSQRCDIYDYHNAPQKRRKLLKQVLDIASEQGVDSIWIGRDLGYRGGRRTGLPMTDDTHFKLNLNKWGVNAERTTKGKEISERTSTIIWDQLKKIDVPVFIWNVFPLHPHEPNQPLTNRAHNAKERDAGIEILNDLIKLLKPKRLIAIGNDAENALKKLETNVPVIKVRHPSYGGQNIFIEQVKELYLLQD
ncbi:uracil-DNA glycosylase [Sessilibacter corallicola]|uniref:uracil-DNA glycosylase n=1 Tax=Sessilibacter corallicola TaxID=2904075 RepID=UPI001E439AE7|nr:uracil-DNA glycosylase [Sessilibacter corallicola]MCE2030372.1 uracil-DNA glycosylase [Sessilibacter corallicola]